MEQLGTSARDMHLPNLFAKGNAEPVFTQFFAIQIGEIDVQASLWRVGGGAIETMASSQRQAWHDESECVAAIDRALQELGETSEVVSETLFALPSEWVSAEGILADKKPFFQRLTKELSLKAIGFVVTTEACVQHLAQTISPQLSIFFIEVLSNQLVVSLVKQGQLKHTVKTGRSGDAVSDLTEAFAHFTEKPFPGKMLLFSTTLRAEELHEIRQRLFQHNWAEAYSFLQAPVIDLYPSDNLMEMIIHTGGRAVAQARGLLPASAPLPGHPETEGVTVTMPEPTEQAEIAQQALKGSPPEPELEIPMAEARDLPATPFGPLAEASVEDAVLADNFTAVSPDVLTPSADVAKVGEKPEVETAWSPSPGTYQSHTQAAARHAHSGHHPQPVPENDDTLEGMDNDLPANSSGGWLKHHVRFVGLGVGLGVFLLLAGAVVAAQQLTQAQVTIALKTQTLTKDVNLTLDPQATGSDPEKLVLKAELVTKEFEGEQSADTTGTKIIGDKATGKVTLFNRTSGAKVFPVGTKLTAGKLVYTLDQAITVASASTGYNFEVKPGSAEATVTAAQIGSESNIDKDVEMSVDNFSKETYIARSLTAFAGGTSREIRAVSKEDRAKLLAELQKKLLAQATDQFKADSTGGKYYVGTGKSKVLKTEYSGDAGKEANSLSLKLKLQVEAATYETPELRTLATAVLRSQVPEGFTIKGDPQVLSTPTQSASGSAKVVLQTSLSATAVPTVDPESWRSLITGKTVAEAKTELEKQSQIRQADILLTPFPLILINSRIPAADRLHITTDFP